MPKWLRKSFVVMITILTFGMITPSQHFLYDNVDADKSSKRDIFESKPPENFSAFNDLTEKEEILTKEMFVRQVLKEAEDQSYLKFGNRIKPVIEDEFRDVILPKIETALNQVASQYEEERLVDLTISEQPGGGNSEKIFHIMDNEKDNDIIRFHVRKDHPPQEGYWFNFHYHTFHDQYQAHHDLGSIYWDKNTPPKWMS